MWRDASKSAFIFGLGTFIIVSSSYTTDMNIRLDIFNTIAMFNLCSYQIFIIAKHVTKYVFNGICSLISVLSYVGLVYLAAIFLFRSILHRYVARNFKL